MKEIGAIIVTTIFQSKEQEGVLENLSEEMEIWVRERGFDDL